MYVNRNNIVSTNEANALKEMIFQRVKERAEALSAKAQGEYTDNFTNDIMDIARLSVTESKNPFAMIVNDNKETDDLSNEVNKENIAEEGIGFKQRKISKQILATERSYNLEFANAEVERNMVAARSNLNSKQSFIGALDFLNQQASLDITIKKGKKFDAIA